MASKMRSVLVGCSLPLLLACGSAPKETVKSPVVAPPAPLQIAAPAPDLSPVAAPVELVALGRFARPAAFLSTIAGWVGIPFEPKMVDAIEPGLSEALALDAPVEFAVTLPSGGKEGQEPSLVVSFGVASTERAKSLLEGYNGSALQEQSPMVWVAAEDAKAHCAVAPALGKVNARLVCANKAKGLTALLPYATRGLPLEDLGTSDLRAEIRVEPLQQRFAAAARMGKVVAVPEILEEIALGDPRFDRPLADATHAAGDELLDWFEDLARIRVDLTAKGSPEEFDARFTINYKSRKSLFATLAASAAGRMGPPSPLFFDLPANATQASYVTATDPKAAEKAKVLGSAVVDGFLAHLNVSPEVRRDFAKGLEGALSRGDATVSAHLNVESANGKPPTTDGEKMASMLGQYVVGIDGPAAPYQAWLKSLARLYGDRTFKKGVDQLIVDKLSVAAASKSSASKGKVNAKTPRSLFDLLKVQSKTLKGLPKGSEALSLVLETKGTESLVGDLQKRLHRRGKVPKLAVEKATFVIAVVPDGSRTWMLMAADEKAITALAKSVLTGSTAPKLSTRADVAVMRGRSAFQAGFFSLASFKGYLSVMLQTRGKSGSEADTLFSTLPNHGTTPVFYQFAASGDEQRPTVEGSVTLPRVMFDDIAASVPTLMMTF